MYQPKLWFSLFDFSFNYVGNEPNFIEESFSWSLEFEENWKQIREELELYLTIHKPEAYFNKTMVNSKESWKTLSLKWWDIKFHSRNKYFPKTLEIVNKYPEILSVSFNLLEPNGKILPHCGDTNAIYRCHLGIKIPDYLPKTGFRVREEIKSWEEGKWLIFMDAYNHEAFNFCDKKRIIMVIDIMRPEFQMRRRKIISTVLTSLFLQKRAQKFTFIYKLPQWAIRIIAIPLIPIAYLSVKCINFLRIY